MQNLPKVHYVPQTGLGAVEETLYHIPVGTLSLAVGM